MSSPNPPAPFTGLPDYPVFIFMRRRAQWVAWKYEFRNGPDAKPTKPPVSPRSGFPASHSNPATWATYEEARDCAIRRGLPGVGYVLTDDDGICGIDLDNCRDPETGALDEWALEIVNLCETYTEASPSGRGVRLFALGKPGKAVKRGNVEIYGNKRYLTVTGNHLGDTPLDIKPAPWTLAALEARVAAMEPARAESAPVDGTARMAAYPAGTADAELRELLFAIDPNCAYPEWIEVLMALHDATNGGGIDLADQWSAGGSKYKSRREIDAKWKSFRTGGGVGIGTLAEMARRYGADLGEIAHRHSRPAGYDPVEAAEAARILGEGMKAKSEQAGKAEGKPRYSENEDGDVIDNETGEVVTPPAPAVTEPTGEAIYPPGLVGYMARWIVATAPMPQPELAIAAALTIVGTAAGRQWEGPHGAGLALYILALAPTGKGKDAPMRACKRILTAAGMGMHLGPDQWMSASGLCQTLGRQPLVLCPQDEFGSFMKKMSGKRASSHEQGILAELRKLWGTQSGVWSSPQWAGIDSFRVEAPCVSIFGASTHEQFYTAIEGGAIADGTLNRFLIVEGRRRVELCQPEADANQVPEEIIRDLQFIRNRSGEVFAAQLNAIDFNPALTGQQVRVAWCPDGSEKLFKDFQKEIEEQADRDPGRADFMVRVAEMAARIATIIAIGREGVSVRVEDMRYGIKMARDSMNNMMSGAEEYMAANEQEANVKRVLSLVKRKGHIKHSSLMREVRHIPARAFADIIKGLEEEGSIRVQPEPTKGRKGTIYVAV